MRTIAHESDVQMDANIALATRLPTAIAVTTVLTVLNRYKHVHESDLCTHYSSPCYTLPAFEGRKV